MKGFILAAATAATMLTAGAAQAGPTLTTYAQSREWPASAPTLSFTNNASGTGGTLTNAVYGYDASVGKNYAYTDFEYLVSPPGFPSVLQGPQLARMFFSATSTSNAIVVDTNGDGTTGDSGDTLIQRFQSGTLQFKRDTPSGVGLNGGDNLLTISFTNMTLSGTVDGGSATTMTTTPSSSITITSDFFDFSMATAENFAFSMSAVIPNLELAANGSVSSFDANANSTFASNPPPVFVPEPGMLGLFGAGAFGLAFARRRKS